ncbi:unnamed protein product [Cylindrotheca closterium]|uniref:Uncharacterized protein n=1 Tax=Cylindrotheca closterium TaxID=2856 RepID=A0AAD2FMD7_9STRA|nr:unnamed protein product [Cylindrotheca closterium]
MPLVELSETALSLQFLALEEGPHFLVRIKGRTKGMLIAGRGFEIPCIAVTGISRLKPGRWVQRLGPFRNGKLFQQQLAVPSLLEFKEDFFEILIRVQDCTDLISPDVDLQEKAGILRTLRRNLTSHAINMQVPEILQMQ